MKKISIVVFYILMLCVSTLAMGGQVGLHKYKIVGNVNGLEGWVYLELAEGCVDSTLVQHGQFTFEGSVNKLDFAQIYNDGRLFLPLIADSENITVTGDVEKLKDIQLTGSPLTDKINSSHSYIRSFLDKVFESPTEGRDSALADFKKELSSLVAENADNLAGVANIIRNAYYLSAQEKLDNISLLSLAMQEHIYIQKLVKVANAQLLVCAGKPYTDIQLTDTLGRNISLSEVLGKSKYVLIDFWASWCGPCIASLPDLKKVYDKYHAKGFEIFGVSLDSKRDLWTKAIVKHGIGWHHASALAGWDCPAAKIYGIEAVPSTFLIGPDGVILKKDIRIDELEQILQNNL